MNKSHLSHMSAMESVVRSKEYHEAGNEMFNKSIDSYKEGQQFWAAATEALLDAKRREREVDNVLEDLKANSLLPIDYKTGEAA
jgi:exonuclease VII small subunit